MFFFQSGWTPLIIAASAGRDNIVKMLLERKAEPNNKTFTGHTALHYAASRNRFHVRISYYHNFKNNNFFVDFPIFVIKFVFRSLNY